MRILVINPILYTSETDIIPKVESIKDTMIYSMCLGFIKNGHEPVLIAASDYKPEKEERYPFEIVWMNTAYRRICKPRCLPYLPGLGAYIRKNKEKIDGVVTSEVFSLCSLTAVRRLPNKTIVWHELGVHNKMLHYVPSKIWYNLMARLFFGKVKVVPRSEKAKDFIQKYCRNISDITIDHGVDINKIKARDEKENYFAVVSQLIPRKRVDKIIQVFAEFLDQGEETKAYVLHVIGRGESGEQLREQAKRLGIEESVIFHGQLSHEQLAPILACAKSMLVYTEKDSNMVSIPESIAAGTPVITTSIPFTASYVEKEKLGIVDDNWDKDALNRICRENGEFVKNCLSYREKLTAEYCTAQFVKILKGLTK